jgi:hypothetical protein
LQKNTLFQELVILGAKKFFFFTFFPHVCSNITFLGGTVTCLPPKHIALILMISMGFYNLGTCKNCFL